MIERRTLLWFYGFCYSVFWGPAALQACMDSFVRYARAFSPFPNSFSCPIGGNRLGNTPVARLFLWCCPPAIALVITFVVVDSINRMFLGWSLSHIAKKVKEVASPAFANCNPSRIIRGEISGGGSWAAASHHKCPSVVLLSRTAIVWIGAVPMLSIRKAGALPLETAT